MAFLLCLSILLRQWFSCLSLLKAVTSGMKQHTLFTQSICIWIWSPTGCLTLPRLLKAPWAVLHKSWELELTSEIWACDLWYRAWECCDWASPCCFLRIAFLQQWVRASDTLVALVVFWMDEGWGAVERLRGVLWHIENALMSMTYLSLLLTWVLKVEGGFCW